MPDKPLVTKDIAVSLARDIFNVVVDVSPSSVKEFASYDDRNFYLLGRRNLAGDNRRSDADYVEFLLKVTNQEDSVTELIEESNALMILLNKNSIPCPVPQPTASGKLFEIRQFYKTTENDNQNENGHDDHSRDPILSNCAVRLFNFLPGKVMVYQQCDTDLFYKVGCFTAEVDKVLKGFECTFLKKRDHHWDLKNLHRASQFSGYIKDTDQTKILKRIEESFTTLVEPKLDILPKQCIHGDINDTNLLSKDIPGSTNEFEIAGLIDFGDVNYTCRVFEVSITAAYMAAIAPDDPVEAAVYTVAGYQQNNPLTEMENDLILNLIEARLYQSICFGAYTCVKEPSNAEYLSHNTEKNWIALKKLGDILPSEFSERWHKLIAT